MKTMLFDAPNKTRLAAGVARALLGAAAIVLARGGLAQENENAEPPEEVVVTDRQPDRYRVDTSSIAKLTGPLRDTPQSVTLLSRELLEDRAATTLNDALRSVPSITLGAGEFSWQGNNPSIRGFSSRNDMFLDGMRDFGSYSRDPFNLEAVEVLEGPSSTIFGRGSTGGVINQASKMPHGEAVKAIAVNGGSASTLRATADVNQPLPDLGSGAALRVNVMGHQSETVGRDGGEARRHGIAPTLALGLDSPTRLTFGYFKQTSDDTPDYGLPWLGTAPAPVRQENFYGFESDYLETEADVLTASLAHDLAPSRTLRAQLRYAEYSRDTRLTEPLIVGFPADTPLEDIAVTRNVFIGSSEETMLQAQIDVTTRFRTGTAEHTLVGGIEAGEETSAPSFGFGVGVPPTSLLAPVVEPFTAQSTAPRLVADTVGRSVSAFVLDTIALNARWQVALGLRWDRFDADYEASRFDVDGAFTSFESIGSLDEELSYRAALVYKPRPAGSVYIAAGTSFNPSAEAISFVTSGRGLAIGNAFLDPEENESVEIGTKWDLIDDALAVTAAVFRITKSNARVPDPENPGFNMLAGAHRVDGLALNATGRLGDWQLSAGYALLDSEVTESAPGAAPVGSPLPHAPEQSLSAWAAYAVSERLEVAGGVRYVDERLARNVAPVRQVPSYRTFEAMAKYRVSERTTLKLNVTNLTDEYYYDQLHPFHVVPGPGVTAIAAVNFVY